MELNTNPYKALGLDIDAPLVVIKAAYKALMKSKGHPDSGGTLEFAQKINEAYQILTDDKKRKEIDSQLRKIKNNKTDTKNIYYLICNHCQTLNIISNPQFIQKAQCYQCGQAFMSADLGTKAKRKEKIDEKLAFEFYNRKMYFRAIKEFGSLTTKDPKNAYFYLHYMGMCFYQQSQFRESLRHFLKSLTKNPHYFESNLGAGRALLQMHQYSEALVHFQNCLGKIEPDYKVNTYMGISYYKLGMFEKAIKEFLRVVDKDPTFEQAIYFLSLSFYQVHDFLRAKKYLLMAKFHYHDNEKIQEMIDYCNQRLVRM